ncbi:MAG TPA: ATP-binding sensor histidine kinase [Candidatus Xenobia bacterium]
MLPNLPGYRLDAVVHRSARTTIYRGVRLSDGEPVVLKASSGDHPSKRQLARLQNEGDILQRAAGPGIVRLLGEVQLDGQPALVLEDRGGRPLREVAGSDPMASPAVVDLACRVVEAIEGMHAAGISHRDLNPSNIIVTRSGEVQIIDFGLASLLPEETTEAGTVEGTLAYLSPEQSGLTSRPVDYRTDFYALGATLYELLSGRPPFFSDDPLEVIHGHLARPPAPLPGPLGALVLKLLAKAPEDRYQSAAGLLDDLRRCSEGVPFTLGATDVCSRLTLTTRLYAREDDLQTLQAALAQARQGVLQVALVHGPAGVGKTALVRELFGPVASLGGLFGAGKCDELHQDVPYFALAQALRALVRRMLAGTTQQVAGWRAAILEAVGESGQLAVDTVPELARIVGPQPHLPDLPPLESGNRHHRVMHQFLGSLAVENQPLVLCLDDLQWADPATLRLLESLTVDSERGLLLICAWRDDEVGPDDPLHVVLARLRASPAPVSDIALSSLEPAMVTRLIAEALSCAPTEVAPLADLALTKTGGNPFFLKQFLAALHSDGLLAFDTSRRCWTWDFERVCQADITQNVADLMGRRIRALSPAAQSTLSTAACIGARFDLGVLATALGCTCREAAEALRPALEEGLVLPVGHGWRHLEDEAIFRFLHDRVRQAAAARLRDDRRSALHLTIGRRLRERASSDPFEVLHHLNQAHALMSPTERAEVARLNVEAGRRAAISAAYDTALVCLHAAMALVDWEGDRTLMIEAHLQAGVAASMTGDVALVDQVVEAVLQKAQTPMERARALRVRLGECLMRGQESKALEVGLEALAVLGERFPSQPTRLHVGGFLLHTAWMLKGRSVASLASLPEGQDPHHVLVMELISKTSTAAFICQTSLLPVLNLRLMQRSLRYGVTAQSAASFVMYGIIQATLLGRPQVGERFGQIALDLARRFPMGLETVRSRFGVLHLIRHWSSPARPLVDDTLALYRTCLEVGDFEYAQFMAWAYCRLSWQTGVPLAVVDREVDRLTHAVAALRRGPAPPQWQLQSEAIAWLAGRTDDPTLPSLSALLDPAVRVGNKVVAWTGAYEQAWLYYLAGQAEKSRPYLAILDRFVADMAGLPEVPHYHFMTSLIGMRLDGRAARGVEASLQKLRRWATAAPANYAHRLHLVSAEWLRVHGRGQAAAEAYDRAVQTARQNGFQNDEALALELAAEWYLESGRTRIGRVHMTDAMHGWERWGALGRVRWLRERHADLLAAADAGTSSHTGSVETAGLRGPLDVMAIMKAGQAISGEIVLDRLVRRLLGVTLEGAGAQRAVLVLDRPAGLTIEAVGEVGADGLQFSLAPRRLTDASDLAVSVVQYVARTREAIVVAQGDETFTDAYVQSVASIMAVPVASGVLYVENSLTPHAFTEQRQQLLRTLGAQAAVSLENARLYAEADEHRRTLEARVAERTEELRHQNVQLEDALARLREAQSQVVAQQKLAYLGTLTAGIAHEIRNPLNFVTNFAAVSLDMLEDDSVEVDSIRLYLTKIREHAARADDVVKSMLLHAGKSSGEREAVDLNALVEHSAALARHGQQAVRNMDLVVLPDPTPPPLQAAPKELARAFLNIIGNAIQAAAERARRSENGFVPQVRVEVSHTDEAAVVRVRDNGDGIPAAVRDKLFNPFFTTRPTGQGTGLGLSITHDIVVGQHGGRVLVDSVPGEWAEFVIELPLAISPDRA